MTRWELTSNIMKRKESLSAASAGPLDKKTIAQRAVCEDLSKIRPLAGASANVKRVSNEGSVTCKNRHFRLLLRRFWAQCQKGSDPSPSRARPRRNPLLRFPASAKEKLQMTKWYRT